MSNKKENLKKSLTDDSFFDLTITSEKKEDPNFNVQIQDNHYVNKKENIYNTLNESVCTSLVRTF